MTLQRPPADTPVLYGQEARGEKATVHAHYFIGSCDWLITEYDPVEQLAYGWCCLGGDPHNAEMGYISLVELDAVRVGPGFTIDYDLHWEPAPLDEAREEILRRHGISA